MRRRAMPGNPKRTSWPMADRDPPSACGMLREDAALCTEHSGKRKRER